MNKEHFKLVDLHCMGIIAGQYKILKDGSSGDVIVYEHLPNGFNKTFIPFLRFLMNHGYCNKFSDIGEGKKFNEHLQYQLNILESKYGINTLIQEWVRVSS